MPRRARATDTSRAFLRRLPLGLVAAMLLWLILRPALDTAVCWTAQTLTRAFEHPRVTRLVAEDHRAHVRRSDLHSDSIIPAIPLTEIHFNTIVLLALYLTLKRPHERRQLERLLMGWTILFLTQALNLLFHVKVVYAMQLGEWSYVTYSEFDRNLFGFLRYFTDLPGRFSFPFLIWMGFNWDRVMAMMERLGRSEADDTHGKKGNR